MITKYKTIIGQTKIEVVQVDRENELFTWVNGWMTPKHSPIQNYFDSFNEAKEHLVNTASIKLASIKEDLEQAKHDITMIERLQENDL
jgi:hypothetical protein